MTKEDAARWDWLVYELHNKVDNLVGLSATSPAYKKRHLDKIQSLVDRLRAEEPIDHMADLRAKKFD